MSDVKPVKLDGLRKALLATAEAHGKIVSEVKNHAARHTAKREELRRQARENAAIQHGNTSSHSA